MTNQKIVVFDLGNVLVRWNPRNFFRGIFNNDDKMEWFLTHICSPEWNLRIDAGLPYKEAAEELKLKHPEWTKEIDLYDRGWEQMFGGVIEGSVEILKSLKEQKIPVYAITNWSQEKFPRACELFPFFKSFDGAIVSGEVGVVKPNPKIFEEFLKRYNFRAAGCLFTDDMEVNIAAANKLGFQSHLFTTPDNLRAFLIENGFSI